MREEVRLTCFEAFGPAVASLSQAVCGLGGGGGRGECSDFCGGERLGFLAL